MKNVLKRIKKRLKGILNRKPNIREQIQNLQEQLGILTAAVAEQSRVLQDISVSIGGGLTENLQYTKNIAHDSLHLSQGINETMRNSQNVVTGVKSIVDESRMVQKKVLEVATNVRILQNIMLNPAEIPPARGHQRIWQLALLHLLELVDRVMDAYKIEYFIHYGVLIGAYRNGGFVPWDDDIDICIMREDYEKAEPILRGVFRGEGFDVDVGDIMRVFYTIPGRKYNKSCRTDINRSSIFIDIFPMDFYHCRTDPAQFKALKEKRLQTRNIMQHSTNRIFGSLASPVYAAALKLRDAMIMENKPADKENGDVFMGVDFPFYVNNSVYRHEHIFPLKQITFEGCSFPCPNDVPTILLETYGDITLFPNNLLPHDGDELVTLMPEEVRHFEDFTARPVEELFGGLMDGTFP
ncbi:MAG: LicD family protein [Treponema sp.]|jgi:lipopolysaccharide cholinephosphotransferase|nr:LicD family protein [Treponema sp.]